MVYTELLKVDDATTIWDNISKTAFSLFQRTAFRTKVAACLDKDSVSTNSAQNHQTPTISSHSNAPHIMTPKPAAMDLRISTLVGPNDGLPVKTVVLSPPANEDICLPFTPSDQALTVSLSDNGKLNTVEINNDDGTAVVHPDILQSANLLPWKSKTNNSTDGSPRLTNSSNGTNNLIIFAVQLTQHFCLAIHFKSGKFLQPIYWHAGIVVKVNTHLVYQGWHSTMNRLSYIQHAMFGSLLLVYFFGQHPH